MIPLLLSQRYISKVRFDYSFVRFKDDEPLESKCHTENYNGFFNAYVPEARVEVIQLDDIRHCLIFEHINESDSGVYVVRAINALGEAVCESEIEVMHRILKNIIVNKNHGLLFIIVFKPSSYKI